MWDKARNFRPNDFTAFKVFQNHTMVQVGRILDIETGPTGATRALIKTDAGRIVERTSTGADEEWIRVQPVQG